MDGIALFSKKIKENLIDNRKFLSGRASYLFYYGTLAKSLLSQEKKREQNKNSGIIVPPIMIISITNICNMSCKGCFANAQERCIDDEMSIEDIDRVIGEAYELGVGIIMLAGGEPLMKSGVFDIVEKYNKMLFVIFTNGTLIDSEAGEKIGKLKNLLTAYSLEGDEHTTDDRRGRGAYKTVKDSMEILDKSSTMFGTSITLTSKNFDMIMGEKFLDELESMGCRVIFFIEYVPCNGDKELCLTVEQKLNLTTIVNNIKKKRNMLPIALPGDEKPFDGCLAASRGFIHISSVGSLEPCPFAPFSDVNVKKIPLREALQSNIISKIREKHNLLEESEGGCALFENASWVKELMDTPSE